MRCLFELFVQDVSGGVRGVVSGHGEDGMQISELVGASVGTLRAFGVRCVGFAPSRGRLCVGSLWCLHAFVKVSH